MTALPLADRLLPVTRVDDRRLRVAADLALVLLGSLVVAVSARIWFPLPFTPVPVTLQPFAVLLVGAALGSRRGAAALLAYLAQGVAGLPVFFAGGFGLAHLMGPTGGFLISYPLAAFVVGALAERGWDRRPTTTFAAMLLGSAITYLVALPWLALFVGAENAVATGLLPFVGGDLLKIAAATFALPFAWRFVPPADDGGS